MYITRWKAVLVGVVALAVIVPAAAFAATSVFDDVADDSVYVSDINWLAAAGVTKGCNPPANTRFCPSSNVTREQMAAFMHRLAANQVVDAGRLQGYSADQLMGSQHFVLETYAAWDDPEFGNGFLLEQDVVVTTPGWIVATGKSTFESTLASPGDWFSCAITDGSDPDLGYLGSWGYNTITADNPSAMCYAQTSIPVGPGTHTIRYLVKNVDSSTTYATSRNLIVSFTPYTPGAYALAGEAPRLIESRPDPKSD